MCDVKLRNADCCEARASQRSTPPADPSASNTRRSHSPAHPPTRPPAHPPTAQPTAAHTTLPAHPWHGLLCPAAHWLKAARHERPAAPRSPPPPPLHASTTQVSVARTVTSCELGWCAGAPMDRTGTTPLLSCEIGSQTPPPLTPPPNTSIPLGCASTNSQRSGRLPAERRAGCGGRGVWGGEEVTARAVVTRATRPRPCHTSRGCRGAAAQRQNHLNIGQIEDCGTGFVRRPKGQQPLVPYLFGDTTNRGGDPAALA